MPTYEELLAQADELRAQAAEIRRKEIEAAITMIQETMARYDLSVRDIEKGARLRRLAPSTQASPAKYRGPNGESWSGGRGRKPQWLVDALAQGKSIEDFRVPM